MNTLIKITVVASLLLPLSLAKAGDSAGIMYHDYYVLAAAILRSAAVCPGPQQQKQNIDLALDMMARPEIKAIVRGFPNTTKQWGFEGVGRFNNEVMQVGVARACAEIQRLVKEVRP